MSRIDHRLHLFFDRDVVHASIVAGSVCLLTAGLVYVGYFVHVVRTAHRAPCSPDHGRCLLLFGKHAPQGRIDADFAARLDRAAHVWRERPPQMIVLLGGGPDGHPSEAQVAHAALLASGVAADAPWCLEQRSRDTLQNLRNARSLLAEHTDGGLQERVTLLSNRYHLARCALFARQLGMHSELCAAEPRLRWSPRMLSRLAGEAAYLCLVDIGTRWARIIGHRRMLARVT